MSNSVKSIKRSEFKALRVTKIVGFKIRSEGKALTNNPVMTKVDAAKKFPNIDIFFKKCETSEKNWYKHVFVKNLSYGAANLVKGLFGTIKYILPDEYENPTAWAACSWPCKSCTSVKISKF